MKRIAAAVTIITTALACAATAQARLTPGDALLHAGDVAYSASCPAETPTQTITVVDQANVRPFILVRVENAIVVQSLQLRAAWGTPCVRFGAGGWPITLVGGWAFVQQTGAWGYHVLDPPSATIDTVAEPWSTTFSHEIAEMLVVADAAPGTPRLCAPTSEIGCTPPEVCDPVEDASYNIDGVAVSDFALPDWFTGGRGPYDVARKAKYAGDQI